MGTRLMMGNAVSSKVWPLKGLHLNRENIGFRV